MVQTCREGYVGKRVMVMDVSREEKEGRLKWRRMGSVKHDLEKGFIIGRVRGATVIQYLAAWSITPHESWKICGRRRKVFDDFRARKN